MRFDGGCMGRIDLALRTAATSPSREVNSALDFFICDLFSFGSMRERSSVEFFASAP
jgi:hypothetical protein